MSTKLTLTIEQEIIARAKRYAKQQNRSLSDIIENYLKLLTTEEDKAADKVDSASIVGSLQGTFKAPVTMDYKTELGKRLEDKYL